MLTAAAVLTAGVALAWAAARTAGPDRPPPVPAGDGEVAWIQAATNGASWERFVTGVHKARHDCPQIEVDDSRAFLDQTTAVPEVVVGIAGTPGRLHIRWYKLTSATDSDDWVTRLATRESPPLAFIGGGTSDRAGEVGSSPGRRSAISVARHGPAAASHHGHRHRHLRTPIRRGRTRSH